MFSFFTHPLPLLAFTHAITQRGMTAFLQLISTYKSRLLFLIGFFLFTTQSFAQQLSFWERDTTYNKKRVNAVAFTAGGAYAGGLTGLYFLWYADFPLTAFHTFNDNNEWLQIDKGGHLINAYWSGKMGIDILKWAGMNRKKAIWYGGSAGLAFMTSIEIFDGFSEAWGFSTGDIISNTTGAATAIGQELLWNEQRIEWKLSFHPTEFAKYRPDVFGSSLTEKIFKDYNGHTYWLSGNISSFLKGTSQFPKWLNVAVGYGADGLTGGSENVLEYDGKTIPYFKRTRQYYLAPDINFTNIKTRSKFLKFVFAATRFIKFPLPALEYNSKKKWVVHALYF